MTTTFWSNVPMLPSLSNTVFERQRIVAEEQLAQSGYV
jgi:hypothetical protein